MLTAAHTEVMPIGSLEKQMKALSPGSTVTVSCSPKIGVNATVEEAVTLASRGFDVVPHLAARQVAGNTHLQQILKKLSDAGIDSIFVPGGDVATPTGDFDSSLQLLRAMSELDHNISRIGVAAYPEGHPFISEETLIDTLRAKQEFATSCVTQMCFSGYQITNWIERIRDEGITLPVRLGLPGAVERKKLFAFSLRIGVGDSARFSMNQPKVIRKLMAAKIYQPDDLMYHLADYVADARLNIVGFHLYTFNQLDATNRWRESFIQALGEELE
jgi:methylenetetrahydrofolate reductase (NADPH)